MLESQLEEFDKLSRMIDSMLTLARAEAGQIRLAREPVCLTELTGSLVEQMEALAAKRRPFITKWKTRKTLRRWFPFSSPKGSRASFKELREANPQTEEAPDEPAPFVIQGGD